MLEFIYILISCPLIALIATPSFVFAKTVHPKECISDSSPNIPGNQQEEYQLLKILEKHTKIATKTRLNADFVPGMVTVLYGDDLEARGIRTFMDALNLVPGLNSYIVRQGFWLTSARGGTEAIAVGNLKILIDDIPVNTAFATDPVPNIPVEQIERIDIIRGPGSAIYGEFATAGVVNIITRKNENRAFFNFGSYDTYGGGGVLSWSNFDQDLKVNLNIAGWKSNGADIETGPDTLYGRGLAYISNAPGNTNEVNEYGSAFFNLAYKKFTFNGQLLNNKQGDFFGVNYALPPPTDQDVYDSDKYGLEARQEVDFFSFLHTKFNIGWQQQKFKASDSYLYPPNYTIFPPTGDSIIYPDGWLYSLYYEEEIFHGGVDFTWTTLGQHDFLVSYSFKKRKANDVWFESNFYTGFSIPRPIEKTRLDGAEIGFLGGRERDTHSVTVQDAWRVTSNLTLTGSLRYDNYSDITDAISPRFAAVYRLNSHHIFKTQYARAFRPPSFWELYSLNNTIGGGNPDLKSLTNDTCELGYIYKDLNRVFRTTLFYSILNNLTIIENANYQNTGRRHYWGTELELEQQLGDYLKVDANLSYVHTQDVAKVTEGVQAANWISNIGIIYHPTNFLNLALQYRYVGERGREPLDPRENLAANHTVDLTGSLLDFGIKGLIVRVGIKNLFNEDIRHPAPLEEFDPYGNEYPSYPEDFPRAGRNYWCQVTYIF